MAGVELWYCLACQVTSFRWCRSKKGTLENHGMSENVKLPIHWVSVAAKDTHASTLDAGIGGSHFLVQRRWQSASCTTCLMHLSLATMSIRLDFLSLNFCWELKAVIWWECACLELWNAHLCLCVCVQVHVYIYYYIFVPLISCYFAVGCL